MHKIYQLDGHTANGTAVKQELAEEPEDVYPFASRFTVRFPRSFTSERIIGEMDDAINLIANGVPPKKGDGTLYSLYDTKGRLALYQAAKEILLRQLAALKGES